MGSLLGALARPTRQVEARGTGAVAATAAAAAALRTPADPALVGQPCPSVELSSSTAPASHTGFHAIGSGPQLQLLLKPAFCTPHKAVLFTRQRNENTRKKRMKAAHTCITASPTAAPPPP